jgi:serine/threonine-protein kinase
MQSTEEAPPEGGTTDPKRAAHQPAIGSLIGVKFQLVRLLGEGAMGLVYEGRHRELNQRVAIKFLRREMLSRADVVQRFDREAKIVAQLHGDHVARVLDVGEESGQPFIVMEFLRGGSVAQLLATTPQLSFETAASYAIEACAGLAEAHAAGIVHRDIKPDNLFLTTLPDGSHKIKLLDFGVSKAALGLAFEGDGARTDTMVGSPLYMSPEQVRAQEVTPRSDLWSLGATLFEMLTGRPPFEAPSLMHVCSMVLEAPIPDVRSLRPDCPDSLAETVARCLTRDPAARIASAGDLAMELVVHASARAALVADVAVALSRSGHATSSGLRSLHERASMLDLHLAARSSSGSIVGSNSNTLRPSSGPVSEPPRRRPWALAGAALALLLLGLFFWSRPAPTSTSAAATPPPAPLPSALAAVPSAEPPAPASAPAPATATPPLATPPIATPSTVATSTTLPAPVVAPAQAGNPAAAQRPLPQRPARPIPTDDFRRTR